MFMSILVSKIPQFLPKSHQVGQLVILFQKEDSLMTNNLHYVLFSCHSQIPTFYTAGHGLLYVKIYLNKHIIVESNIQQWQNLIAISSFCSLQYIIQEKSSFSHKQLDRVFEYTNWYIFSQFVPKQGVGKLMQEDELYF